MDKKKTYFKHKSIRKQLAYFIVMCGFLLLAACPNQLQVTPSPAQTLPYNKNLLVTFYKLIRENYINPISGTALINNARKGVLAYLQRIENKTSSNTNPSSNKISEKDLHISVEWQGSSLSNQSDTSLIDTLWDYLQSLVNDQEVVTLLEEDTNNKRNTSKEYMLVVEAMRGMLDELNDKYGTFITQQDLSSYYRTKKWNTITELGIKIAIFKNTDVHNKMYFEFEIAEVFKDGVAYRAGIRAGDLIKAINNKETQFMNLLNLLFWIKDPASTQIALTLKIPEQTNLFPLTLTKQCTETPSIQHGIISADTIKTQLSSLAQQAQDIGYIHLLSFTEDTANKLREILYWQLRKNVQGFIIDLRDNPGGSLRAAIDIADYFLARGKTVIHIKQRRNTLPDTILTQTNTIINESTPIVLLMNEGSASSSELLIAAMTESRKNITLVGSRSYGKGLIQIISTLDNNHIEFHLTTAEFLSPDKHTINKKGFTPQITIGYSEKAKTELRTFLLQGALNKFIRANISQLRAKQLPETSIQNFITTTLATHPNMDENLLNISVWNEVYRIHDNSSPPYNIKYDKVLRSAIPYVFKPFGNTAVAQNTYAASGKTNHKSALSVSTQ